MKKRNLAPWNWFKHDNVNPPLREDYTYSHDLSRRISSVFESFFKDLRDCESFIPSLLNYNDDNNLKILPRIDISDNEREYIIETDLPGVKEEDLDISVSRDGILTISGQRECKEENKDRNYYSVERSYGVFERSLYLPQNYEINDIKASFKDGVLVVRVPKKEPLIDEVKKIELSKKTEISLILCPLRV